jgi:hypothetical protein
MAKLYLVKTQILVLRVGERGAGFLPHPVHGAAMFQSGSDLDGRLLSDLYLLPLAELAHTAFVSTELKDPITGEEKPVATALYPALFAFEHDYVLSKRAPLAPKRATHRFDVTLWDYRIDIARYRVEIAKPFAVEAEVVEAEVRAERTAGTGFVEKVEVDGATLSRLVVPLATVLGFGGSYEPFKWIAPCIDATLAKLKPLRVSPVYSFELKEERGKRRRQRGLWGRGEGWQATLEAFLGGGDG